MNKNLKKQGFTLLFAALVGALVLAIGAAILLITMKQLALSSAGRATQQSFYSADAGIECALFLDRGAGWEDCKLGFFPEPSDVADWNGRMAHSCIDDGVNPTSLTCMGRELIDQIKANVGVDATTDDVTTTFELKFDTPLSWDASANPPATNDDTCFKVSVTKRKAKPASGSDPEVPPETIIESRGYNTCNENAINRFERAIRSVNQ